MTLINGFWQNIGSYQLKHTQQQIQTDFINHATNILQYSIKDNMNRYITQETDKKYKALLEKATITSEMSPVNCGTSHCTHNVSNFENLTTNVHHL